MEALTLPSWDAITSDPAWGTANQDEQKTIFDVWREAAEEQFDLETASPDNLRQFNIFNEVRSLQLDSGNGSSQELDFEAYKVQAPNYLGGLENTLRRRMDSAKAESDWTTRSNEGRLDVNPYLSLAGYDRYKEEILATDAPRREKIEALSEFKYAQALAQQDLGVRASSKTIKLSDRLLPGKDVFNEDSEDGELDVEAAKMFLRPQDIKELKDAGSSARLSDPGIVDDVAYRFLRERGLTSLAEEALNGSESVRKSLRDSYMDSIMELPDTWAKDESKPEGQFRKLTNGEVIFNRSWLTTATDEEIDLALGAAEVPAGEIKRAKAEAQGSRESFANNAVAVMLNGSIDSVAGMVAEGIVFPRSAEFRQFYYANKDKYETNSELLGAFTEATKNPGLIGGMKRLLGAKSPIGAAGILLDMFSDEASPVEATSNFLRNLEEGALQGVGTFGLGLFTFLGGSLPGMDGDESVEAVSLLRNNIQEQDELFGSGSKWGRILGQEVGMLLLPGAGAVAGSAIRRGVGTAAVKSTIGRTNFLAVKIQEHAARRLASRMALTSSDDLAKAASKSLAGNVYFGLQASRSAEATFQDAYINYRDEAILMGMSPEEAEASAKSRAYPVAIADGIKTGILMKLIPGGTEALFSANALRGVTFKQANEALGKGWLTKVSKNPRALATATGQLLKPLFVSSGKEAVEEFTDELLSGVIAMGTYNPEMQLSEAFEHALTGALAGGILGSAGAINSEGASVQQAERFKDKISQYLKETAVETASTSPETAAKLADAAEAVDDQPVTPDQIPPAQTRPENAEKLPLILLAEAQQTVSNKNLTQGEKRRELLKIRSIINSTGEKTQLETIDNLINNIPKSTDEVLGGQPGSGKPRTGGPTTEQKVKQFDQILENFSLPIEQLPQGEAEEGAPPTPRTMSRDGIRALIDDLFAVDDQVKAEKLKAEVDGIFASKKLVADSYLDVEIDLDGEPGEAKGTIGSATINKGKLSEGLKTFLDKVAEIDTAAGAEAETEAEVKAQLETTIVKAYDNARRSFSKNAKDTDKRGRFQRAIEAGEGTNGLLKRLLRENKTGDLVLANGTQIENDIKKEIKENQNTDPGNNDGQDIQRSEGSEGGQGDSTAENQEEQEEPASGSEEAAEGEAGGGATVAPEGGVGESASPSGEFDGGSGRSEEEENDENAVNGQLDNDPLQEKINELIEARVNDENSPSYGMPIFPKDITGVSKPEKTQILQDVNSKLFEKWGIDETKFVVGPQGQRKAYKYPWEDENKDGFAFVNHPYYMASALSHKKSGGKIKVPEGVGEIHPRLIVEDGFVVGAVTDVTTEEFNDATDLEPTNWGGGVQNGLMVVRSGEYNLKNLLSDVAKPSRVASAKVAGSQVPKIIQEKRDAINVIGSWDATDIEKEIFRESLEGGLLSVAGDSFNEEAATEVIYKAAEIVALATLKTRAKALENTTEQGLNDFVAETRKDEKLAPLIDILERSEFKNIHVLVANPKALEFAVQTEAGVEERGKIYSLKQIGAIALGSTTINEKSTGDYSLDENRDSAPQPVSPGEILDGGEQFDQLREEQTSGKANESDLPGTPDTPTPSDGAGGLPISEEFEAVIDAWDYYLRNIADQNKVIYPDDEVERRNLINDVLFNLSLNGIKLGAEWNITDEAAIFEKEYGVVYERSRSRAALEEAEALQVRAQFEALGLEADNQSGDIIDALRIIAEDSGSDNYLRTLSQIFLNNPKLLEGTTLRLMDAPGAEWAGLFSHRFNTIVFNVAKTNPRGVADTLVHEGLHRALDSMLESPQTEAQEALVKSIDRLVKAARLVAIDFSRNSANAFTILESIARRVADESSVGQLIKMLEQEGGFYAENRDLSAMPEDELRTLAYRARLDINKASFYANGVGDLFYALGMDGVGDNEVLSPVQTRREFLVHSLTDLHFQEFLKRVKLDGDRVDLVRGSLWSITLRNFGRMLTGRSQIGQELEETLDTALTLIGDPLWATIPEGAKVQVRDEDADLSLDNVREKLTNSRSRAKLPLDGSRRTQASQSQPLEILGRVDPGRASRAADGATGEFASAATEDSQLSDLARVLPGLSAEEESFLEGLREGGQEHDVTPRVADRIYKSRKPLGGEAPGVPFDYVLRVGLFNQLFGTDIQLHGLYNDRLITSQQWIRAEDPSNPHPTADEVRDYLESNGWSESDPTTAEWAKGPYRISDAYPDNFIKTEEGVQPIDLFVEIQAVVDQTSDDEFEGDILGDESSDLSGSPFEDEGDFFGDPFEDVGDYSFSRAATPELTVGRVVDRVISDRDMQRGIPGVDTPEEYRSYIHSLASQYFGDLQSTTVEGVERMDVLLGNYGPTAARHLAEVEALVEIAEGKFLGKLSEYAVMGSYSPEPLLAKAAAMLGVSPEVVDDAELALATDGSTLKGADNIGEVAAVLHLYRTYIKSFPDEAAGLMSGMVDAIIGDPFTLPTTPDKRAQPSFSRASTFLEIITDAFILRNDPALAMSLTRESYSKDGLVAAGIESNRFLRSLTTEGKLGKKLAPLKLEAEGRSKAGAKDAEFHERRVTRLMNQTFGKNPTEEELQLVNIVLGTTDDDVVLDTGAPGAYQNLREAREVLRSSATSSLRAEINRLRGKYQKQDPERYLKEKSRFKEEWLKGWYEIEKLYQEDLNKLYAQAVPVYRQQVRDPAVRELKERSKELYGAVESLRKAIDTLSDDLVNSGILDHESLAELKIKIQNNRGIYLMRSYEIHDRVGYRKWLQSSDPEARRRLSEARDEIRGSMVKEEFEKIKAIAEKDGKVLSDADLKKNAEANVNEKDVLLKLASFLNSVDSMSLEGGLGLVNLGVLKERKDIGKGLRVGMGQYDDNVFNAARTMVALSSLVANQKFLRDVETTLNSSNTEEVVVITKDQNLAIQNGLQKLGGDRKTLADSTYGALQGYYVLPEIKQAFEEMQPTDLGRTQSAVMWVASQTMANLTKRRVRTHIRNFFGNPLFLLSSGQVLSAANQAIRGSGLAAFKDESKYSEEFREFMREYAELGVSDTEVNLNIAKEFEDRVAKSGGYLSDYLPMAGPVPQAIIKGLKGIDNRAGKAYQAGDNFWKIVSFEASLDNHVKAFVGGVGYRSPKQTRVAMDNMSQAQAERILEVYPPTTPDIQSLVANSQPKEAAIITLKRVAANKTRASMPVYNNLVDFVTQAKRLGITAWAAPFISFRAEIARIAVTNPILAYNEMKVPETRVMGIKRALGQSAVATFGTTGLAYLMQFVAPVVSGLLAGEGLDDEEEEDALQRNDSDTIDAMRRFLASYYKDGSFALLGRKGGNEISWVDTSSMQPFADIYDPIRLVANPFAFDARGFNERIQRSAINLARPYITEQIWIDAINKSREEADSIQGQVDKNPFWNSVSNVGGSLIAALTPGTIKDVEKVVKSIGSPVVNGVRMSASDEAAANLMGTKINLTDINYRFEKNLSKWSSGISQAESDYRRLYRARSTLDKEEMRRAYIKANQDRARMLKEISLDLQAARLLTRDSGEIDRIFINFNRLSKDVKRSIIAGVAPRWTPSSSSLREGARQSAFVGDSRYDDLVEYYQEVEEFTRFDDL